MITATKAVKVKQLEKRMNKKSSHNNKKQQHQQQQRKPIQGQ